MPIIFDMKPNLIFLIKILLFQAFITVNLIAECRLGLLISVSGEYASGGEECLHGHKVATLRHQDKNLPIKFILGAIQLK